MTILNLVQWVVYIYLWQFSSWFNGWFTFIY